LIWCFGVSFDPFPIYIEYLYFLSFCLIFSHHLHSFYIFFFWCNLLIHIRKYFITFVRCSRHNWLFFEIRTGWIGLNKAWLILESTLWRLTNHSHSSLSLIIWKSILQNIVFLLNLKWFIIIFLLRTIESFKMLFLIILFHFKIYIFMINIIIFILLIIFIIYLLVS